MEQSNLEAIRSRIDYDPDAGIFTWRHGASKRFGGRAAGKTDRHGYLVIQILGKDYAAHRLAFILMLGRVPKHIVDHRNGVPGDNRWSNLREATVLMNTQNLQRAKRTNLSSGLLGVSLHRGKWRAQIRAGGRLSHLGYFAAPEQAHAAYIEAKRRLHPGCTI